MGLLKIALPSIPCRSIASDILYFVLVMLWRLPYRSQENKTAVLSFRAERIIAGGDVLEIRQDESCDQRTSLHKKGRTVPLGHPYADFHATGGNQSPINPT